MPSVRTLPGVRTLTLPDGTRVVADRVKEVTLRLATLDRAPCVERYFAWMHFNPDWDTIPNELTINSSGFVLRDVKLNAWYIQRVWCSDPNAGVRLRVTSRDAETRQVVDSQMVYVAGLRDATAMMVNWLRVRRGLLDTLGVEVITHDTRVPVIVISGIAVGAAP